MKLFILGTLCKFFHVLLPKLLSYLQVRKKAHVNSAAQDTHLVRQQ